MSAVLEPFADKFPKIGDSAYVHDSAVFIGDVVLAAQSSVWPNCTLGGDDGPMLIGAQTSVQDGSVIHCTEGWSFTEVGDRVTVGHNVILHGCKVGNDCLIGMGAIILDGAIIEDGCLIAAGAVIGPGKRIPAGSVVMGNPGRVVKPCGEKEKAMIDHGWQAYVARIDDYKRERAKLATT